MSGKTPKIPKGWQKVRTGAAPKAGDKIWWSHHNTWGKPIDSGDCDHPVLASEICIRRKPTLGKE